MSRKSFAVDGDGFLTIDGERVAQRASPNRGGRMVPRTIVAHETAAPLASALNWFSQYRGKRSASAHIVIARDGTVTQCVPFDRVAWHAGRSSWRGRSGLNKDSIGIELVGPGRLTRVGNAARSWFGASLPLDGLVEMASDHHRLGWWLPFTEAQQLANEAIVAALGRAYPSIEDVTTHYLISPGRKEDPNPTFDLERASSALSGAMVAFDAHHLPHDLVHLAQVRLGELGYTQVGRPDGQAGPKTEAALLSFQKQHGLKTTGNLDADTQAVLHSDAAKPFPNGPRGEASEAEVVAMSRTAKQAKAVQSSGLRDLVAGLGIGAIATINEASQAAKSIVDTWGGQAVLLAAAAALMWWGWRKRRWGARILGWRLEDHRTGRHTAAPRSAEGAMP